MKYNSSPLLEKRAAGVLMHITSLAGPYGIGDMGPAAREFADFLQRSSQTFWQLLPLNPTMNGQGNSPYSSYSAMAGNSLLINADELLKEGLLHIADLPQTAVVNNGKAEYNTARTLKDGLLDKAYNNWLLNCPDKEKNDFNEFCAAEDSWLTDFALYLLFKRLHNDTPWYEWADEYKNRDGRLLKNSLHTHAGIIQKTKWIQMIFHRQWCSLRSYCSERKIRLMGDIPFYVAHDSADVWAHREIFDLQKNGTMHSVAGVPPDAFNDEGQLWGMPIFNWNKLKERKYDWWVERLKRNIELFDVVRLDHFRAFSSYWEVGADAATARTGAWKRGPGSDFFSAINKALGRLSFIAEDLGEIDEAVYTLRDEYILPGMKVLQFAFGTDMPKSPYLPHHHSPNFVVYTGTHDNNTTIGWFNSLNSRTRKNVSEYFGTRITTRNISEKLCRLAYSSVCNLAILPLQDILELDESARMNTPATGENNWTWRIGQDALNNNIEKKLRNWCDYYDRKAEAGLPGYL